MIRKNKSRQWLNKNKSSTIGILSKGFHLVNSNVLFTIPFACLAGESITLNIDTSNIVSYNNCSENNMS